MIECIKSNINYSELPFFARESYLKTISEDYGWLISDNFLLPFIVRKKYFFRFITFTNGTVFLNNYQPSTNRNPSILNNNISELQFLNEVIKYLKKSKYDFITQPPTNVLFKVCPDSSNFCKFGTYNISLNQSEDILFSNIHSKHKNVIRKAVKDGVLIERGFHLNEICHQIINDTLKKQGISFIKMEEYKKMINNTKENIEFFVSKNADNYEGAAIIPFDKKTAYYLYGGSVEKHHLGTMNLLHWEAIKYFKQINVENYNFVGARILTDKDTKIHGIQEFKRRFGGKLEEGYLWKYSLYPYKKLLYDLLIFIKIRKFPKDIIDNEKYKFINNV